MHTHEKDDEVQFAVTLTPATTKAEKKNKDTSGVTIERVLRDIPIQRCGRWEGLGGTRHSSNASFKGLMSSRCDENSGQWLSITVILSGCGGGYMTGRSG
jgi:hypothetical protein